MGGKEAHPSLTLLRGREPEEIMRGYPAPRQHLHAALAGRTYDCKIKMYYSPFK